MNWLVMGFGDFNNRPGETDMILPNANNGGVEVYDISNNQIIGAAFMGTLDLNWQFAGGPESRQTLQLFDLRSTLPARQ